MTTNPSISVIVVNYQRAKSLDLCLWGLEQQTVPYELIVTDDGSTDESARVAVHHQATLITAPHQDWGIAPARWRGAQVATGDLLVFVDSDVVLAPWSLEAYRVAYMRNPNRALGGYCKFLPAMEITTPEWTRLWQEDYEKVELNQGHIAISKDPREAKGQMYLFADPDQTWPQPFSLISCNMAVPRHVYEDVGGWNRTLTGRGEDGEFSLRLALAGHQFSYLIEAQGVHLAHPVLPYAGPDPIAYLAKQFPHCFENGQLHWPPKTE